MKIGIVGYGSIGSRHAVNAAALGHEVIVYDPMLRRDVTFERNIYESCDAVVIASPTRFHDQGIRACVERGVPVLVEKPIALAEGLLASVLVHARDKGTMIMMGNNLRLHPCVQQAKRWLSAGDAGEPLWASFICGTMADKYTDDGVILNTGAHEVDLALYFFGPGQCVSAHGDAVTADFVIKHNESGVRSVFHLDLATPHRIREFWIAGEKANIGVDLDARRMSLGTEVKQAPGSYNDDYVNEMSAFIDRINGVFAPGATGEDGLATLQVLLDVKKKAGLK